MKTKSMTKQILADILLDTIKSGAKSEEPRLRLSAVGLCQRATVLSIKTGITPDFEDMSGILYSGKLHEQIIKQAFDGWNVVEQKEVELEGVKGHIDFYLPGENVIIECKTISLSGMHRVPIEHHIWQVAAYMEAVKEETGETPQGFIVYFAREDPQTFRVYEVVYSQTCAELVRQTLRKLQKHLEEETIPPIPPNYRPNKFPCQWFSVTTKRLFNCPFRERCWGEDRKIAEIDDISDVVERLAEIDEEIKRLSMEADELKSVIKNKAENGELNEGTYRFKNSSLTIKYVQPSQILDAEKLVQVAIEHGIEIPVKERKGYWVVKVAKVGA